ncbi:MAG: PBSX family phage terminase large subunit [Clostridia bacterium]
MRTVLTIRVKPTAFNAAYFPHIQNSRRYQIYYGGSSSGKSVFLATRAVLDCLSGRNYLVVRKVARTLRGSCWNEIQKAITRCGLNGQFRIRQSDMIVEAIATGAQIVFAGLDDVEKIKSITPAKGVFTDIWMEEATECEYSDYKQLDKRLRGRTKFSKRFTLSFNPVFLTHWIYVEFFSIWDDSKNYAETERLSILKTTHTDNRFLAPEDHDALENEQDEYFRNVYTYGNWGILGDVIFRNWRTEDLSEYTDIPGKRYYGLDFGFSSDPAAAINIRFERAKKRILVLDELYERGLTNTLLAERLRPFAERRPITCDCAEPKSIAELRGHGINAIASKKGADSVIHGIQWLQGYEIVVDVRCQNLRNELTLYQWRKDKDGNSLRDPVDKNNHLIDAMRYALESEINGEPTSAPPKDYGNDRSSYWQK